jgi:hypothetical protein
MNSNRSRRKNEQNERRKYKNNGKSEQITR